MLNIQQSRARKKNIVGSRLVLSIEGMRERVGEKEQNDLKWWGENK